MQYAKKLKKLDKWEISYDFKSFPDTLVIKLPNGKTEECEFFYNIPAELVYDEHGYEKVEPRGQAVWCARYFPPFEGKYEFTVSSKGKVLDKGTFEVAESNRRGFITINPKDKRYFAYDDGETFCPIGINMAFPTYYNRTDGTEFGTTSIHDTLGYKDYSRWIKKFAKAGGNYLRLWLGTEYFCIESPTIGNINYLNFARIDAIVELARKYNIKLKLTFEQFRHIGETPSQFYKMLKTPEGRYCESSDEWLTGEVWQNAWKDKIKEYIKRYKNDPTVAVWELWNEMLCYSTNKKTIVNWTANTVKWINEIAPKQLCTTSFGSYNPASGSIWQEAHSLKELNFIQIHRYLDQGEGDIVRRTSPIANLKEAVTSIKENERPMVIAETGAVNDNHSGPNRFYLHDDRGIIFADVVYSPFFFGSAGCGQIWHWDGRYVDAKNLYPMFKPFFELVKGIDLPSEKFECIDLSDNKVWCLILKGKENTLGYIRNKEDCWQKTLKDQKEPKVIDNFTIDLGYGKRIKTIPIWEDDTTKISMRKGKLKITDLNYGIFFKINM